MFIHLVYYSGDRSLVESIQKKGLTGLTEDRTFFLNAVDNDGDAIRFHLNDGSHFDAIFLCRACAKSAYEEILEAIREDRSLIEPDIRDRQIATPPDEEGRD